MKWLGGRTGFLLSFGLLATVIGVLGVDPAGHQFDGRCESCHLSSPAAGEKGIFVRDINYLCNDCHRVAATNSHPTGMFPSMEIPEFLPLDWQGKVTCATCHDPHVENALSNSEMLRGEVRGEAFCRLCHQDLFSQEGKHFMVTDMAHNKKWSLADAESAGQRIDEISRQCISCHDGVVGPEANYWLVDNPPLSFIGRNMSHPIGIDYAHAAMRNRELKPVDSLSPLISLVEGMVGCASCHNPYSQERDLLVFNNRGSALCMECHLM